MLVRVARAYGGQEGRRVKAGTIFAVDTPVEGLVTITRTRANQLIQQRIATEATGEAPAAPSAKPAPGPLSRPSQPRRAKVEPDSAPPAPAAPSTPNVRSRARRKAQEDSPREPRRLSRQNGGQDGKPEQPASSSPEVRQAGSVTLRQRGTRRGQGPGGLPSTTPGGSSLGRTRSTPATAPGGESTTATQSDSAAFD